MRGAEKEAEMKKLITALCIAVGIICSLSVFAAERFSVEISIPETFMHIQEYKEAYFDVIISNKGESAEMKIEYTRDNTDEVFSGGTVTVGAYSSKTVRITENLPKGGYVVSAKVTCGDETLEVSKRMTVLEKYKDRFMDEYTRIGIHAKLPEPSVTSSAYKRSRDNMDYGQRLMKITGFKVARYGTGLSWTHLEKEEGKLTWEDLPSIERAVYNGATSFLAPSYTHSVYGLMNNREARAKLEQYFKNRIEDGRPNIKFWAELGNEPDLDKYWKGRDIYGINYMDYVREASLIINDNTRDFSVTGGTVSGGTDAAPLLHYMFEQDAYKYLDAFSYHPYMVSATVDTKYDSFTKNYENAADGKGGWIQKAITEIGWPSVWEATPTLPDHAGKNGEITKTYLKTYLHDLDLTCWYALSEKQYGICVEGNYEDATACLPVVCQITKMLNGTLYAGEFPIAEGAQCAMFVRDGKPLMAVWMPGDEPITYTFNTEVSVEDMSGNPLGSKKTVEIGDDVYWISGFGKDYIYKTAHSVMNKVYSDIAEKYAGKFDMSILNGVKAISEEEIGKNSLSVLKRHYDVGDKLIDEYISGKTTLELPELTQILFDLHISGEKLASVYAMDTPTGDNSVGNRYNEVQAKVDAIKGEEKHSIILYTDKMLKYARRYYVKATECKDKEYDPMQTAIIRSSDFMSERISNWAEKLIPVQEVDDTIGILTIVTPVQKTFDVVEDGVEVAYSVDNRRITPVNAYLAVFNGNGDELGERVSIEAKPGEYKEYKINVLNDKSTNVKDMYKIRLYDKESGKLLNERWFPISRKRVVDAELAPAESVYEKLGHIGIVVQNNTGAPTSGKIEITDVPEGWALETTTADYTLEAFERKTIKFKVLEKRQTSFNIYAFGFKVNHADGSEIENRKAPLSFPFIVKSKKAYNLESFNGDMTDWTDAYPVYANASNNRDYIAEPMDKESWRKADNAAIVFYKWDNNNLYMLANVFDNKLHGNQTGDYLWQNDSVQLAIDPRNNAGEKMQNDDYMMIYGGGKEKGIECYTTSSPSNHSTWEPLEDCVKIIRDNSRNITRYLIKVPFSSVTPLEAAEGTKFRMNSCYNDADVEIRHRVDQVNLGLKEGGDARSPQKWYEYQLCGYEKETKMPDDSCLIDVKIDSDPLMY